MTARIRLEPVGQDTQPEMLLDVFNSNPDFLWASEEKYPYTADEIAMYLFTETNRENSRCLLIRLAEGGEIVGTAALVAPHPEAGCPWIGLLLIGARWQGQGIGAETATLLEGTLTAEGWQEARLSVLKANPRARRFWERQGYQVIAEGQDRDRRPCWVMSKALTAGAS